MTPQLRKIIIIIAGIILFFVVLVVIFNTSTTAEVTIKTNNQQAKVVVGTAEDPDVGSGSGDTSLRLTPGTYTIRVTHKDQETRALIAVKTGQTNAVELNLTSPKKPSEIAPFAATNMRATNEALTFIWGQYNQLAQLPEGSSVSTRLNKGEFEQAVWVNDAQAFLLDTGGVYYYFDGQPKTLPYGIDPYTLSTAASGAVAYAQEQNVFVRPSAFAEPTAQFITKATQPQTALGSQGHVLVYDLDVGPESSSEPPTPEIFKDSTKVEKASELIRDLAITGASWSPDGKKLALSATEGLYVLDVTTDTLNLLYKQMPDNPESIVWRTNDTLLYLLENTVWQVALGQTTTWVKIAHVDQPLGVVGPLALSPNGRIYFSTNTSLLQGAIFTTSLE